MSCCCCRAARRRFINHTKQITRRAAAAEIGRGDTLVWVVVGLLLLLIIASCPVSAPPPYPSPPAPRRGRTLLLSTSTTQQTDNNSNKISIVMWDGYDDDLFLLDIDTVHLTPSNYVYSRRLIICCYYDNGQLAAVCVAACLAGGSIVWRWWSWRCQQFLQLPVRRRHGCAMIRVSVQRKPTATARLLVARE